MLSENQILDVSGVLSNLREYISQSGFKAGERLPPERELTTALGVTRNTLRKALDALEREGTIWRHVGKAPVNTLQNDAGSFGYRTSYRT